MGGLFSIVRIAEQQTASIECPLLVDRKDKSLLCPAKAPVSSPDGRYLYYQSPHSSVMNLYRKRLDQSSVDADELVAEDIVERTFAPTEKGVYFLRAAPNKTSSLIVWDPIARQETLVTTLSGRKVYGLSASRDGEVVFLSKVDQNVGQIIQLQPARSVGN